MFAIEIYEDSAGYCEVLEFMESLRTRMSSNKDARIQYQQMVFYIELLKNNGTTLSQNIMKHLEDGIWELRPGNNRVFFFFAKDNTYVLLHHFRKTSQKTPRREIIRAKEERADYLSRRS